MKQIHGMTIYCDAEDYEIVQGITNWEVNKGLRREANFPTEEEALAFVDRRTNPKTIRGEMHDDICRCGWTKRGWDYVQYEGIVYERCNHCRRPLRMLAVKLIKEELLKDFDLDAFINGD